MKNLRFKRMCEDYYGRIEKEGAYVLTFSCPYCNGTLKSEANETHKDWDTLSTCWHCQKSFMKITPANTLPIETFLPQEFEGQ